MTAVLPEVSPDLRALTDDDLAELFAGGSETVQAAVLAECARQDAEADRERKRAERGETARARRAQIDAAWYDQAYSESRQAEAATRGYMLTPGAPGRDAFPMLWTCSDRDFARYASDEMKRWREFDAPSFTRRADYFRQAMAPRKGDNPWHDDPERAGPTQQATPVVTPEQEPQTPAGTGDAIPQPVPYIPSAEERRAERARTSARLRANVATYAPGAAAGRSQTMSASTAGGCRHPWKAGAALCSDCPRSPADVAVRTSATVTAQAPGMAPRRPDIDGERLLEQAGLFLLDFASFPSPAAAVACTLWAAHAVARDADRDLIWRASPRLLLTSSENGSGKSTVLDLLAILTRSRAGRLGTVTAPGLVQLLGQLREPAFPDEVQSTFGNGRRAEEVRRIINAGYTRRAAALTGRGAKASLTNVFGPVAMAGLDSLITDTNGRLADTLARCIVVRMQRPDRRMPELDERGEDRGDAIAGALAGWTAAVQGELRSAAQDLADAAARGEDGLDGIGDGGRVAQIWRPLLSIADVAGGMWPAAARDAVWELSAAAGDPDSAADAMAWLEDESAGRSFFDAVAGQ